MKTIEFESKIDAENEAINVLSEKLIGKNYEYNKDCDIYFIYNKIEFTKYYKIKKCDKYHGKCDKNEVDYQLYDKIHNKYLHFNNLTGYNRHNFFTDKNRTRIFKFVISFKFNIFYDYFDLYYDGKSEFGIGANYQYSSFTPEVIFEMVKFVDKFVHSYFNTLDDNPLKFF